MLIEIFMVHPTKPLVAGCADVHAGLHQLGVGVEQVIVPETINCVANKK